MKLSKNYFNMVEIVLALAVVSVAIVSLMGMLPVALRASKNSVADNSVASVIDLMKSKMDRSFQSGFDNLKTSVPGMKPSTSDTFEYDSSVKDYNDAVLENYAFQIYGKNGKYLAEFFSGKFDSTSKAFSNTDFQADVRVWRENIKDIYIPYDMTKNIKHDLVYGELPDTHGFTVCIEVSWPSGISYENQEHRLYKFDYFAR
jgi:competence protein ComGC